LSGENFENVEVLVALVVWVVFGVGIVAVAWRELRDFNAVNLGCVLDVGGSGYNLKTKCSVRGRFGRRNDGCRGSRGRRCLRGDPSVYGGFEALAITVGHWSAIG
jgi:hypothetical protein